LRHLSLRLPGVGRVRISSRPPAGSRNPVRAPGSSGRREPAWIIFSPGALTRPGDYPELLAALTAAGAAVLTLDYDWPALFAGEAGETARAWRAADRLLRRQLPARGLAMHRLPPMPSGRLRRSAPPLRILGYSLGGHVLSAGFQRRSSGRDLEIILLGASNLREPWRPPASKRLRMRLLAGTEDGVISLSGLAQLAVALDTPVEWLADVNHFGILDPRIGAPAFRARDHAIKLSARQCAERIARQVLGGGVVAAEGALSPARCASL
jgi:hypothetical protein